MLIKCPECGYQVSDQTVFKACPRCGYAYLDSHVRSEQRGAFLPGFLVSSLAAFLCYGASIYNRQPSMLVVVVGFAIVALFCLIAFIRG
ncbi:MAG: zinc-ribbon domain-containing protein [Ktedonobacteraceae bacterium]|nr:zinc-ribbon domain-containing protein [Ktedonobacteraceae bacterium]